MNRTHAVLIAGVLLPLAVYAQDAGRYQCTQGDLTRRVEIVYETGVTVPCEVHYYKDTEAPGERQTLWRALNEEGYCEAKASEFVGKLSDWGWDCSQREAATQQRGEADDTEALAPAEPIELPEDAEEDPR